MASKKPLRTIDVKPTDGEMVKPGELIEFKEMVPLSLADRRIFNTLVRNAWDSIDEPKEHSIRKVELRGSHNVNDRIGDSIERLMTVIVRHPITRNDGKLYIRRFHLLDTNDEAATDDNGLLHYSFPAALRALIKQSTHYALLKRSHVCLWQQVRAGPV